MGKGSGESAGRGTANRISKLENRLTYLARATTVDSFRIPDAQVEKYRKEFRRVWTQLNALRG